MPRTAVNAQPGSSTLTGWGRAHHASSRILRVGDTQEYASVLRATDCGPVVPRGCGSSYGDAATNAGGAVLDMTASRQVRHLDVDAGIVVADSGLTIGSLLALTAPHGWRPPVLPGTPNVSLGGAVAADIHGKNHPDAGSFGRHIDWILVLGGDLQPRLLSPEHHFDEFWATVGGLGLTGPILTVALRLAPLGPGPATTRRLRANSLRGVMDLLTTPFDPACRADDDAHRGEVQAVAWLDGGAGGRGLVDITTLPLPSTLGRAAAATRPTEAHQPAWPPTSRVRALSPPREAGSAGRSLPSLPGTGLITRTTVRAAAAARWSMPGRHLRRTPVESAVFPLRHAGAWPALFGSSGLIQYQFAVPTEAADVVAQALALLAGRRLPPALATLKKLGAGDPAPLGFALPGWTLAVDLPARWAGLNQALDDLDRLVIGAGGRVYLAKDLRLDPSRLEQMYPRVDHWRRIRDAMDPDHRFGSDLSQRLHLTPAHGGSS